MTKGEWIAAVIGAVAALPVAYFGFVIGGMVGGVATGGLLAIPGALIGAAVVPVIGRAAAVVVFRIGQYFYRLIRRGR